MLRIRLLNRITMLAHRRDERSGADIQLCPPQEADYSTILCSETAQNNDITYKDALLDTQARLFFRNDIGKAEPANVRKSFANVLARIDAESNAANKAVQAQEASARRPLGATPSPTLLRPVVANPVFGHSFRVALSNSLVARVLPGGVALGVLLFVLGSNAAQLRGIPMGQDGLPLGSDSGAPSALISTTSRETSLQLQQVPQINIAEVPSLHPVELGMKRHDIDSWKQISPRDFGKYSRTKFGPE